MLKVYYTNAIFVPVRQLAARSQQPKCTILFFAAHSPHMYTHSGQTSLIVTLLKETGVQKVHTEQYVDTVHDIIMRLCTVIYV